MTRPTQVGRFLAISLITLALLAPAAGCLRGPMVTHAASFGAGWLIGAITTPRVTETTCYRNGVEVDCSELPQLASE